MAAVTISPDTVVKRISVSGTTVQQLIFGGGVQAVSLAGDNAIRVYWGAQTDGAAPSGTDYLPLGPGQYAPIPTTRGPVFVMGEGGATTISVAQLQ